MKRLLPLSLLAVGTLAVAGCSASPRSRKFAAPLPSPITQAALGPAARTAPLGEGDFVPAPAKAPAPPKEPKCVGPT